ncbi:hypothetical protein ANN_19400 [Periplaneta americana]|uniref:Tc1-like transposase DDE domain-containing protein n=1 Tax=Periplaneta americana TaxID=6978 RepID=A0ABQ8S9U3_PERAM|nr:hypothetical protein ANN_19400 [Periplaneta americana]
MAWPARSPDINPIEHVWGLLGKQVRSRSNLQQLRNVLSKEWNRIDQTDIQNLIEGLNRRMFPIMKTLLCQFLQITFVEEEEEEEEEEENGAISNNGYDNIETRRAFQKIRQVNVSERTVRGRLDDCGLIPEDQLKAQNCSSNIMLNDYVLLTIMPVGTWGSGDECSSQMNRDLVYRWT